MRSAALTTKTIAQAQHRFDERAADGISSISGVIHRMSDAHPVRSR
jgi:hypothetical protein